MALRPIFEVCVRDMVYEGGGNRGDAWWDREAEETHIRATLEEILQEAMRRQQG